MPRIRNKEKQKVYRRRHYLKHKERLIDEARRQRAKINEWFKKFKMGLKCVRCGESHPACLEFHHTDPSKKDFVLGNARHYGIKRIMSEVAKCVVLCANCHRKEHHK